MQKNLAVIIDIGSSKITVMAGERGINNTFLIKGLSEQEYSGFSDGVFFDQAELDKALKFTLKNVAENIGAEIKTVYVGVPGEFTTAVIKENQIAFKKSKRITDYDIEALFNAYVVSSKKYSLINRSGVYFALDDTRRVADPLDKVSKLLKGKISYILCDNNFINSITPTIKKLGVQNVEYTSTALAEALYLFEPETRDRLSVLVDCGYITTSFSLIEGDAIIYQKGFSFGGGYITAMLVDILEIDAEIAEKLKRKASLSSSAKDSNYTIIDGDHEYTFPSKKVNEIVRYSLDELAENIDLCLADMKITLPEYVPLSLTGGGVCFIRGAKEHLENRLNMVVETKAPPITLMNKPTESATLSLLDLALKQAPKKENFFKKLFK